MMFHRERGRSVGVMHLERLTQVRLVKSVGMTDGIMVNPTPVRPESKLMASVGFRTVSLQFRVLKTQVDGSRAIFNCVEHCILRPIF